MWTLGARHLVSKKDHEVQTSRPLVIATERPLLQRDKVWKRKITMALTKIAMQANEQLLLGAMCTRRHCREGMKVKVPYTQ